MDVGQSDEDGQDDQQEHGHGEPAQVLPHGLLGGMGPDQSTQEQEKARYEQQHGRQPQPFP